MMVETRDVLRFELAQEYILEHCKFPMVLNLKF